MNQAHCFSLDELKKDEMFDQIQPDNIQKIMEGIIMRLQRELKESQRQSGERLRQIKRMKERAAIQLTQKKPVELTKTS